MSFVNRSLFLNMSVTNPAHHVVRSVPTQPKDAHLKSNRQAAQQNMIDDHLSGFQCVADTESSEQYLWSAAWFVMFLLFLCTT